MSIFNQGGLFFSLTAPDQVLQRKKTLQSSGLIIHRAKPRLYAYHSEYFELYPWRFRHHSRLATRHPGQHHSDRHAAADSFLLGNHSPFVISYGNEAIHVDELEPGRKNGLLNAGGTVLNILWFIFFGWWLCLMHIFSGIAQCLTIIGIPVGIANFKIAAIALWPVGRRVVSVETARAAREANARRRFQ